MKACALTEPLYVNSLSLRATNKTVITVGGGTSPCPVFDKEKKRKDGQGRALPLRLSPALRVLLAALNNRAEGIDYFVLKPSK
jgi:hypothetical protein